jgi:hypothetical protein
VIEKFQLPTMAIEIFGCLSNNDKSFSIVVLEVTKFNFSPFITEKKASNICKFFAKLKHPHTPFVNGNGLTKVLIEWLGSKLEHDEVLEYDFITFVIKNCIC